MSGIHYLVVREFDDPDGTFEIEHPDDCPMIDRYGPLPDGTPCLEHGCGVAYFVDSVGIGAYFVHVDDPDHVGHIDRVGPGRYEIEAWTSYRPSGPWGAAEWDGGICLADGEDQP